MEQMEQMEQTTRDVCVDFGTELRDPDSDPRILDSHTFPRSPPGGWPTDSQPY